MKNKIPDFKTEKEEADFWDTHSSIDFIDESEQINFEINFELKEQSKLKKILTTVSLNHLTKIKQIAERKKIPYEILIESWIKEAIKRESV